MTQDGIGGSYRLASLDRLASRQRILEQNGGYGAVSGANIVGEKNGGMHTTDGNNGVHAASATNGNSNGNGHASIAQSVRHYPNCK